MKSVLIFADNNYQDKRLGILRAPGAHRIASELRSMGIETEVVDFYLDWTLEELNEVISSQLNKDTLFIGFSCSLMFSGVNEFTAIREFIHSVKPRVPIIIGGYNTTQKNFNGADYYIEGYGEYALRALVAHLQDNTKELKFDVDEYGNKVVYTKTHYPVSSLKSLQINYLPSDFINPSEVLSLETARGCIFKCKFCNFQLLGKSKVDYLRDVQEIKDELIGNYEKYGVVKYIITEDTFNDTDDKVNMLYEITQSLPFKLNLMGYIRADLLAAKPDNLRKLVASGFTTMHFGIETFNENAGKVIGKGMTPEKLKEALLSFKQAYPQLYINGTFIIGLPGESEQDIKDTVDWLIKSKAIDFWTFNPVMILKKHKLIFSSEFTNNYLSYGYSRLSKVKIIEGSASVSPLLYGTKLLPNMIIWKNQHFDYFSAAKLATEVNQMSNPYKKIDAWSTLAISTLGYDIKDLQKNTYIGDNPLDQDEVNMRTVEFINNYKQKKIKYMVDN